MIRDQLRRDTLEADAAMLIRFLSERVAQGDFAPITTRDALEKACMRRQPSGDLLPLDAAHIAEVAQAIRDLLPK